jgi:hypothetical protein
MYIGYGSQQSTVVVRTYVSTKVNERMRATRMMGCVALWVVGSPSATVRSNIFYPKLRGIVIARDFARLIKARERKHKPHKLPCLRPSARTVGW